MAGAGYKLFNTGDVLTAAQVNTYLMQQTVMVFASSAARTSALSGVLAEGMVSYLQDTNTLEVYDGSSWVGATGDITGLTAGTGISISSATGPVPTVTNSMATEITAKGDLIVGTGSGTFDNLAAGSNGDTVVADSAATTGLRWQGNYSAGKNKIINGDFGIWQRGTSFNPSGSGYFYTADRWNSYNYGTSATTVSRQSFTAGTAPVSGYEGQYFLRINSTSSIAFLEQRIEDVRTFAGQTVTVSFWAKSASAQSTENLTLSQVFGTGGSATVTTTVATPSLTTSWARYSYSVAVPSISGKTIGTNGYLSLEFRGVINNNLDIWGVQIEAGSVATAFQTATGTLQGELAACQRYYYRYKSTAVGDNPGAGYVNNANTNFRGLIVFPVNMRTSPTALEQTGTAADYGIIIPGATVSSSAVPTFNTASTREGTVQLTYSSTIAAGTPGFLRMTNTDGYYGWSAEL